MHSSTSGLLYSKRYFKNLLFFVHSLCLKNANARCQLRNAQNAVGALLVKLIFVRSFARHSNSVLSE